jgi:hypothetical protein
LLGLAQFAIRNPGVKEMNATRNFDYFEALVSSAATVVQILTIARAYLWAWPAPRIAALRQVEGVWAPFDADGRPKELLHLADLYRTAQALRAQCAALEEAGMGVPPELSELEAFFSLAAESVRRVASPLPRALPVASRPTRLAA